MARRKSQQFPAEEYEETRQTILRVAEQLFMQYGYRSVTTRQIAEACGLTQPSLYHHFADKEELYLAVVSEEITKLHTALERLTRRSNEVAERLTSVASFLLSRIHSDLSLMLHDVRHELSPSTRDTLGQQFRNGVLLPIATIFEEGMRRGDLQGEEQGGLPPFAAASLFLNMLAGFASSRGGPTTARDWQSHQAVSAALCVRVLLHGLASAH